MPNPAPLLSVIVVCRDPGPRLRAALASVWAQQEPQLEVVVIDGASADGTREWLQSQRERLGALVSAPDRGIYDAMNRGLALARGEWILFLGADDQLIAGVTAALLPALARSTADVMVGEAIYDDGRRYPPRNPAHAIRRNFIHHQAACYRRRVFARQGNFRANLKVMADYDFNLRLWRGGAVFEALPLQVAVCGHGGTSDAGHWVGYREEITVRHQHFPAWRAWVWDGASVLRFLRKRLRS